MRMTVTGGAGFIGSNIVNALLAAGSEVVVLDDFSSGDLSNLAPHPALTVIEGDIRDEAAVARAVEGADTVFHLAASVGNLRAIEDPVADSEINVIGSLRVLLAARDAGVRKVVASSSAAVYGESKALPICENAPLVPRTPYAASKLAMEHQARAFYELTRIEVVCLRYFNVYGEHQRFDPYGNVIPIFARQLLRGEPVTVYGDGKQTRDFIHVDDVVAANIEAARRNGLAGAYNVASGTAISVNALLELMGAVAGRPVERLAAPPRAGDVRHSRADVGAARRDFGHRPHVTLANGLARYLAWLDAPARVPVREKTLAGAPAHV